MVAAYDNNRIANQVYQHNFGLAPTSVNLEHLPTVHFSKLAADCWLLSPPCQPYTRGGKMLDDQDLRSTGLLHLIRVLDEMENPPCRIFLENVLNFEASQCRSRLVQVLARRGYAVEEYLISPNDSWVCIPNDRLRYYLAAVRVQEEPCPLKNNHIIKSLSEVLGDAGARQMQKISAFLRAEGSDPCFRVPEKYIRDYKNYRHGTSSSRQPA